MRVEERLKMVYVKIRRSLSLWKGEVEQEHSLEGEVEGDPVLFDE